MRRGLIELGLILVFVLLSLCVKAQDASSLSVFSPYTMYGIGELSVGGSTASRSMGGVGVAMRRSDQFNYFNPAAMSAIAQKCAIFNFGAEGQNYYSQTQYGTTSFNSFNMSDLGLAFPLARGVGLGVSLTPLSNIGYSTNVIDDSPSVIENVGRAIYGYSGEGGISQLSMQLGVMVVRNFSLGAALNYNFGTIDRHYNADLYSLISTDTYRSITNIEKMNMSRLNFNFGAQYAVRVGAEAALVFGATYSPKVTANTDFVRLGTASSGGIAGADTIHFSNEKVPIALPEKFAVGVYYYNKYLGVELDYSRQDWAGAFEVPEDQPVTLKPLNDVRFGVQYTPDRYSIRSVMSRWTYKVGFRYANSYLAYNNYVADSYSVSLGVEIPLKERSSSVFNFGVEYGQRGAPQIQGQVFEQCWRFFVGISLFGDDGWFQKRKFN